MKKPFDGIITDLMIETTKYLVSKTNAKIGYTQSDEISNTVKLVDDGKTIWEYEGYVPSGIGLGGGDYVKFEVDTETGQIQNWQPIDIKKLMTEE